MTQKPENSGFKMNMTIKIDKFDDAINARLRTLYLEALKRPTSYDGGVTSRPRVRHHEQWTALPPFGRNGWEATKGVFANHIDTKDVTQGNTWVWSDLHFGHKNIIKFSDRPYTDVDTMNEMLIVEHNKLVQPEDVCIWVGDVAFYPDEKANSILHRLHGYKILVVGNHDFNKRKLKKLHFDEIHIVYNLTVNDKVVAFTHYPMDNVPNGWFNLHGHVHKSKVDVAGASNRHINVNCEFIDYKPINLNVLAERIETLAKDPIGVPNIDYDEYD
jgi:calcineurin-like phosphoesterase family protein